jgi:hypothetical protein
MQLISDGKLRIKLYSDYTAGKMIESNGQLTRGIVTSLLDFYNAYCVTFFIIQLLATSLLKKGTPQQTCPT